MAQAGKLSDADIDRIADVLKSENRRAQETALKTRSSLGDFFDRLGLTGLAKKIRRLLPAAFTAIVNAVLGLIWS